MTPKETHAKQTEFIRVRDTGEVYKMERLFEDQGVAAWLPSVKYKNFEKDEYDFCTPFGFKDGKAKVVDDPTDYDGEMICISDYIEVHRETVQVYGFEWHEGDWYLKAQVADGSCMYVGDFEITDHTPAHRVEKAKHAHENGEWGELEDLTPEEVMREQKKIEKLPRNPYKSDYQKTVNELIDAVNELKANRNDE